MTGAEGDGRCPALGSGERDRGGTGEAHRGTDGGGITLPLRIHHPTGD